MAELEKRRESVKEKRRSSGMGGRRPIRAIDLFCGAGGLTHGLGLAGIDVRLGVDIDPACAFPYENNNRAAFLLASVETLDARQLTPHFGKPGLKLLAGCAPCQTFSTYHRKAPEADGRWWLLRHFARLAHELSPDLVTMENVPRLVEHDVFAEFVAGLEADGYSVSHGIVDCAAYGVPQQRRRLVLLASRLGPISLLPPERFGGRPQTVRQAIGGLPPLEAGAEDPSDPLHRCSALSATNLRRIRASRPGGAWRDWPEDLIAACHTKRSGKTYPSVYGRMCWDAPAPTITTQFYGFGNGRFGHPEQDRALSLREGAILQGFPANYAFVPPGGTVCRKTIGRLIGNAVPVALGEVIGKSLMLHAAETAPSS